MMFKIGDSVQVIWIKDDTADPGVVVGFDHVDVVVRWTFKNRSSSTTSTPASRLRLIPPEAPEPATPTPSAHERRKGQPLDRGLFQYCPDALMAVAECSRIGNEQHNPGEPIHWAREKSTDHGDCILRHQMERGRVDTDKIRHSTKVAWRALMQLQLELEAAGEATVSKITP